MSGFLLPRFTLTEARTTMKNCTDITFESIQQGSDKVFGAYKNEELVAAQFIQQSKNGRAKTYDRFLVFLIPGEKDVVGMFTATPVKTRIATRYFQHITPGSPLWLIKVDVKGRLYEENNFVLTTGELFIPENLHGLTQTVKPPYDLDKTTGMEWFAFKTKSLALERAAVQPRVCSGYLCDGFPTGGDDDKAWVGVEKHGNSRNGISARVKFEELQDVHSQDCEISFHCQSVLSNFVADVAAIKPHLAFFDPIELKKVSMRLLMLLMKRVAFT